MMLDAVRARGEQDGTMFKALLDTPAIRFAIAGLLSVYVSLVKHTTRWTYEGLTPMEAVWQGGRGVVACTWHGRILMAPVAWPRRAQPVSVLISRSREGEVVARFAALRGFGTVRGSSRNAKKADQEKGALAAFRAMARHVRQGGCIAVTPDGPRGPRYRASQGAIRLAKTTGAPIVAMGWSTRSRIVFNSWDRFVLPLPFSRGAMVWTEPLVLEPGADSDALEAARRTLETRLIEATQQAERLTGAEIIEPAKAPPAPRADLAL